jgi:hypothetical protein
MAILGAPQVVAPDAAPAPASDVVGFIAIHRRDTGSKGGSVTSADLTAAGVAIHSAYLSVGGELVSADGCQAAMIASVMLASTYDRATYRRESCRRIADVSDARDGERCEIEALLLVSTSRGVHLVTYREKVLGWRQPMLAAWSAEVSAASTPEWLRARPDRAALAALPSALRAAGSLGTTSRTARDGQVYVDLRATLGAPSVGTIQAWVSWLGEPQHVAWMTEAVGRLANEVPY